MLENEEFVPPDKVREKLKELRDSGFDYFVFVTAVDRIEKIELIWCVASVERRQRKFLRTEIPPDGSVSSVADIFEGADWHEREVWDLFGVRFEGHPNLKRILLPDEFEGHPLRKNFPADKPFPPYR